MLVPINSLSVEEKGLLSIMLNLPDADYCTAEDLTKFCSDSIYKINKTLNKLIQKNFVICFNKKYIINKEMIPAMLIVDNTIKMG